MKVWEVVEQALLNPINEVTLSGGDPFYQAETVRHVAKILKTNGKNLWAYTGYTLEFIQDRGSIAMKELLSYCDVLVDGGFELELRDPTLPFREALISVFIGWEHGKTHMIGACFWFGIPARVGAPHGGGQTPCRFPVRLRYAIKLWPEFRMKKLIIYFL